MFENLLILPVILPLFFAILMLFNNKNIKLQRILNFVSSSLVLAIALFILYNSLEVGFTVLKIGSWKTPFGIVFVSDITSSIMLVMAGIVFSTSSLYISASDDSNFKKNYFYPLLNILIMGVNGAFLTGDIFNLYVWYEVMLISSFVLLAMGGKQEQLEGAIKYVTINLLASTLFLAACGIVYGLAGSLNMADLAARISLIDQKGLVIVVSILFLISFGIKSALFPLFFWLPASYHTPPVAISALFAGLLTKVGVYSIYRIFTLIFNQYTEYTHFIILILAAITMVTGVLGPLVQFDFRRILSFHIVSQVGYMILALALFTKASVAAGILYMVQHIIVKTNLFFISGIVDRIKGSYNLEKLGGVFKKYPFLSLLFLLNALSLAGIPPLSGFWPKFLVSKAGFETGNYLVIGVSLFVGLLTLFSMIKIWNYVFWQDAVDSSSEESELKYKELPFKKKLTVFMPVLILTTLMLSIGFGIEFFYQIAQKASDQLMNPILYINAVLNN